MTTESQLPSPSGSDRDVVVTGVGLVSCRGETANAHLEALKGPPPPLDRDRFAPHGVHPAVAVAWDRHIPKKADQRQMEPWQRLGVYAAGAALEDAGLKSEAALLERMHLIVACGGGERDYAVDAAILEGLRSAPQPEVFLNERLMADLRPTLFLAQLSNLLAGNIAIVHGVIGGSRTFMGEEQAGVDALRIAAARIASGQNDLFLVGGATNAERPDLLLIHAMGGHLWRGPFRPVAERAGGGFIPGSLAAFLVLESRAHAAAREARVLARLHPVAAGWCDRQEGAVANSLPELATGFGPLDESSTLVLSGMTGAGAVVEEEIVALDWITRDAPRIATGDLVGHGLEAQFPFGIALAAAGLAAGTWKAERVLVTSVGHHRGEGLALLDDGED